MKHFLVCAVLLTASTAAFAATQPQTLPRSIDLINGHITAEAGQTYGNLETINGGIDLGRNVHVGSVETVNGRIHADDDVATHNVSTVNGGIHFGQQARIDGNLETVNGGIYTDRNSYISNNVSTVNGGIGLVGTRVDGRLETVNGDITVGADSHVKGGIKVEKPHGSLGGWFGKPKIPRIVIGPNASVEGPMVFERTVKLYIHASARIGSIQGATPVRYDGLTPPSS